MKKSICVSVVLLLIFSCLAGLSFAAEKKPIKLGVMFIMSGPMGGYGKHGKQAVQMALDEINASGGILNRKVEALLKTRSSRPMWQNRSRRSSLTRIRWTFS
jgi:branched-chain amino acid transport system substrate-binding protein